MNNEIMEGAAADKVQFVAGSPKYLTNPGKYAAYIEGKRPALYADSYGTSLLHRVSYKRNNQAILAQSLTHNAAIALRAAMRRSRFSISMAAVTFVFSPLSGCSSRANCFILSSRWLIRP